MPSRSKKKLPSEKKPCVSTTSQLTPHHPLSAKTNRIHYSFRGTSVSIYKRSPCFQSPLYPQKKKSSNIIYVFRTLQNQIPIPFVQSNFITIINLSCAYKSSKMSRGGDQLSILQCWYVIKVMIFMILHTLTNKQTYLFSQIKWILYYHFKNNAVPHSHNHSIIYLRCETIIQTFDKNNTQYELSKFIKG